MVINSPEQYEKALEEIPAYEDAETEAVSLLQTLRDLRESALADVVSDVLDDIRAIMAEMNDGINDWEKVWGGD